MAAMRVLEARAERRVGSSPTSRTKYMKNLFLRFYLLVIVLPLLMLAEWYGRNYTGEQIDDFEED